jgi:hypothetical protein
MVLFALKRQSYGTMSVQVQEKGKPLLIFALFEKFLVILSA